MRSITILLLATLSAGAQPPHRPPPPPQGMHTGPRGKWWTNPEIIQKLALTEDQQQRIDEVFQQCRLKLIDLSASLQKEEALLEPMLDSDHPEEPKVIAQIDRIAQARAELEKTNARMLLAFRGVLSPQQWKQLQERPAPPHRGPR